MKSKIEKYLFVSSAILTGIVLGQIQRGCVNAERQQEYRVERWVEYLYDGKQGVKNKIKEITINEDTEQYINKEKFNNLKDQALTNVERMEISFTNRYCPSGSAEQWVTTKNYESVEEKIEYLELDYRLNEARKAANQAEQIAEDAKHFSRNVELLEELMRNANKTRMKSELAQKVKKAYETGIKAIDERNFQELRRSVLDISDVIYQTNR